MARFISGDLKIDVKFNDRSDRYQVKLCPMTTHQSGPGRKVSKACAKVQVGLPGSGPTSRHGKRLSVDDPRALRSAAHAAISFSPDRIQDLASSNRRGSGWFIKPARGTGNFKKKGRR